MRRVLPGLLLLLASCAAPPPDALTDSQRQRASEQAVEFDRREKRRRGVELGTFDVGSAMASLSLEEEDARYVVRLSVRLRGEEADRAIVEDPARRRVFLVTRARATLLPRDAHGISDYKEDQGRTVPGRGSGSVAWEFDKTVGHEELSAAVAVIDSTERSFPIREPF